MPAQPSPQPSPQPARSAPTVQNLPNWLLRRNLPQWIRQQNPGATDDALTGLYRNHLYSNPNDSGTARLLGFYSSYLGNHPSAPGNTRLTNFRPYQPPAPAVPPAGTPTPTAPPPAGLPGGAQPGSRAPGLRNIYDVYLSTIPVMNAERDRQISGAMASAGFTGNRYGTAAMNTAGQIGAETALRQNQLLNSLLYNQNEADANRALQASDQGMRLAGLEDQLQRNRLEQLFGFGRYEQGRMDDYARLAYQDFESNKYSLLDRLIQFAASQSGGSAATPYAVQQPGSTGAADWITLLAGLFR